MLGILSLARSQCFPVKTAMPWARFLFQSSVQMAIPKRNKLPPRPKWLIKEEELDEKFLKGGRGPGGQKINKSNSKVQLTHLPTGLVVTCQYSRSQESNRQRAREILALKLDDLQNPETSRNAIVGDRKIKLKQSKAKKANRKYKVIDEARKEAQTEKDGELEEIVDIEDEFDTFLKSATVNIDKKAD
ncbi:RF-1 domain-containing protein [Scheffersomyces xylosifermentans]|uniref:RF-1 domain-containing protein n=1 Tax=Scheffersomyces xylosifermentans TaxID=1304137 RepID=UPI00315C918F